MNNSFEMLKTMKKFFWTSFDLSFPKLAARKEQGTQKAVACTPHVFSL